MRKTITKQASFGYAPKKHKSYSIDKIVGLGDINNFVIKTRKNSAKISEKLSNIDKESFLNEQESKAAIQLLDSTK
ncbi:MAG: hypothetical protein ACK4NY_24080 [Spirosomataceae bacterium]